MGNLGIGETSSGYEARIPSSSIEDFQAIANRLSVIRKIQDSAEKRKKLEGLLKRTNVNGTQDSLDQEVFEQIARSDAEQPTEGEQRFRQESSYAASQVAKTLVDLNTPAFEGLIVRTDENGDVTDILVKKILPEEDAEKARNRRGLKNLPDGPGKKLIHIPDAPPNALKTRIP